MSEDGKDDSKQILLEVKQSTSDSVTAAMDSYSSERWLIVKESSAQAFRTTSELWDSAIEWLVPLFF